jgi:hypothetical protein
MGKTVTYENCIHKEIKSHIRMGPREKGWSGVDWMHLAEDTDQ